jgi:hypothetical protein
MIAAVFEPPLTSSMLDKNASHRLGRSGKEMAAAVPVLGGIWPNQSQISIVDQGGRLQRLAGLLMTQPLDGQLSQLVIDQRQQLFSRLRITLFNRAQDSRDIAHELRRS